MSRHALPWTTEETVRRLHNACEALAPMFGYATRTVPRPWEELPDNLRALLIATVRAVLIEQVNDARVYTERLRNELRIIRDAKPSEWDADMRDQFREWAQNRARAVLAETDRDAPEPPAA